MSSVVGVRPCTFHSHPLGYALKLLVVPYGKSSGEGTHLSLMFILDDGDNDHKLDWPFRASITIQLVNHVERCENFKKKFKISLMRCIRSQMVQFIPHDEIDQDYIKSDCITLRLTKLKFIK